MWPKTYQIASRNNPMKHTCNSLKLVWWMSSLKPCHDIYIRVQRVKLFPTGCIGLKPVLQSDRLSYHNEDNHNVLVDDGDIEEAQHYHQGLVENHHDCKEDEKAACSTREGDKVGRVWNSIVTVVAVVTLVDELLRATAEVVELADRNR